MKHILPLLVCLFLLSLVGCVNTSIYYKVQWDHSLVMQDGTLYFELATNLQRGTIINYLLMSADRVLTKGNIKVANEQATLSYKLEENDIEAGNVIITRFTMMPKQQPQELQEVYGPKGENLHGEVILKSESGEQYVFVQDDVEVK